MARFEKDQPARTDGGTAVDRSDRPGDDPPPRRIDRRDENLVVDDDIVITNTDTVPGAEIEAVLGVVRGNSVRAKNVGRDITQAIRNLFGGELPQYGRLLADTRDQAEYRLRAAATDLNADAVVTMRIETSEIGGAAAEIHAYGTAVSLK
jgi:uncharacterized protein YbjQ (UPF0145 family)